MEEKEAARERAKHLIQEIQANMTPTAKELGVPDEYFYILRLIQKSLRKKPQHEDAVFVLDTRVVLELLQSAYPEENELLFGDDARAISKFLTTLSLKFPRELQKRDLGYGQIKWYFYPPTPLFKIDKTGKAIPMEPPFKINPLTGKFTTKGMKVVQINRLHRNWGEENF
jgi:hypothetical protein